MNAQSAVPFKTTAHVIAYAGPTNPMVHAPTRDFSASPAVFRPTVMVHPSGSVFVSAFGVAVPPEEQLQSDIEAYKSAYSAQGVPPGN